MYVSTFYSFKGGVGRTQALVNVGSELALRGHKVLLVDFDLEAPGIHTFFSPQRRTQAGGIVEYVGSFLETSVAPPVTHFVTELVLPGAKGELLLMPSGHQDHTYAQRLSGIDWNHLYEARNGYLLFEDLRLQWDRTLKVDYVLIDSRTGHTDIGGICTRQLPDSVVILFLPNDQNLFGLPRVADDIRAEAGSARHKQIETLFVMSNVPDLDDEEHILERRTQAFKTALGYDELAATIHRYDSLALLDQVVFTSRRPETRLAREFRSLTDQIAQRNVFDRAGARTFIQGVLAGKFSAADLAIRDRLDRIGRAHASDPDVLQDLAHVGIRDARYEEALSLIDQAIEVGGGTSEVLIVRAQLLLWTGRGTQVRSEVARVLNSASATEHDVAVALRLLRQADRSSLDVFGDSVAIRELPIESRLRIVDNLVKEREAQEGAVRILRIILQDSRRNASQDREARDQLGLALIGLGRFDEACAVLLPLFETHQTIQTAFNLAIAQWCAGRDATPIFARVKDLDVGAGGDDDPNYAQCLAITHANLGDSVHATERLHHARRGIAASARPMFSAWQYRAVTATEFMSDLDEIADLIAGEPKTPKIPIQAS